MSMLVDIPKSDPKHQQGGCWWYYAGGVVFRCPDCNSIGGLDDHDIQSDGTLDASVVCPKAGCTFHRHVRLIDYP